MGQLTSKSSVEKTKFSDARSSNQGSVQRRATNVSSAARRRTMVAVVNDCSQTGVNDDGVVVPPHNSSLPLSQSDMRGDDEQPSEKLIATDKKISPNRSSIVLQFAEKVSPNEYKCKLCSKSCRCGTGTNASIRRHLANAHGKTDLYSKS